MVTHGWRNCFMTRLAVATARPGNAVLGRHRLGSNPTPTISACIATSGNLQEVYLSPMCFTVDPWIPSVFLYSMLSTSTSGRSSHLNVDDVATVPPSTRASQHAIDLHGQLGSHATYTTLTPVSCALCMQSPITSPDFSFSRSLLVPLDAASSSSPLLMMSHSLVTIVILSWAMYLPTVDVVGRLHSNIPL